MSAEVSLDAAAVGSSSVRGLPYPTISLQVAIERTNVIANAAGKSPAWRLRRFTYDSNEATVTFTLPSRLTGNTAGKLIVWLQTILQKIDRIPR